MGKQTQRKKPEKREDLSGRGEITSDLVTVGVRGQGLNTTHLFETLVKSYKVSEIQFLPVNNQEPGGGPFSVPFHSKCP